MVRRRFAAQLRGFRSRASRLEEFDTTWAHSYMIHNRDCIQTQRLSEPRPMTYDEIERSRPLRDADAAGLAATMGRWRGEVAGHLLFAAVGEGEEDDERAARRRRVVSTSFYESTDPPFPFHNRDTRVVAILGSRGTGKTTLAREVCRAIGGHFDCLAWVSAPPRRDMNDVLRSILGQVEKPRHDGGSDGDCRRQRHLLVRSIRECLQHKRYLVVLDGICSTEAWETIRGALPHNDLGSRVLVTTTCTTFARSCSSGNGGVYYIKSLDFGDSWTLFHRRLFGSDNTCYPTCADVAYKIVEKCSGIPLAMATVSTLLAHKPCSWSLWMHVHNSISKHWMDNVVRNILSLAYHNLPRHLKLCLWHLGVFPADHPIDHGRVIRSWMAEGLVPEKPGKTAEEVAQGYLDELMDWNMIQPDHGGKTKAYLISSLVFELIQSESVEGSFVTILDRKPVSSLPSKIRRLSIVSTNGAHDIQASSFKRNVIPASVNKSHIRSLYIFGSAGKKHSFKHLTFLRVLDLQGCRDLKNHNVEEIATWLCDLRYLSIRDTPISEIPDRIGQLQHLATLDLRGTQVQELPASVFQLQKLTHLLCDPVCRI